MGPEMLLLVGGGSGGGRGGSMLGGEGVSWGAQGGEGDERERGNAPNHDNFSSPQLHC